MDWFIYGRRMHIAEDTLDDLLHSVFETLFEEGVRVKASKGWNTELSGVLLEIRNPRARLSRTETKGTVFSCLGETLWYLAKTNKLDFIKYYLAHYEQFSDDRKTVYGAYGPRLFKMRGKVDQLTVVTRLLREKPSTRQAVIQLFDAEDLLKPHNDIPCTCTFQFFIRRKKLHMMTHMRSNDAFLGLPHDVFAFTFLQEIVARSLGVNVGTYKHSVGSLHLYDEHLPKAKRFLREGWQSRITMPAMPPGNPWPNIGKLLSIEEQLRTRQSIQSGQFALPNYWADLARLLQIYASGREKQKITVIKRKMKSKVYDTYIDKRIAQ